MARHVACVVEETVDGQTEAVTGGLCKKIYDLIATATFVAMTSVKLGSHTAVIIVYDTA